ncbi:MAG: cupin domain-containing protein, partial [Luminiphilus sp.]
MPLRTLTFEFDQQSFLRDVWQQQPLLIKNALPEWRSPLTPEELAGLSLEETADSRLIGLSDDVWQLR